MGDSVVGEAKSVNVGVTVAYRVAGEPGAPTMVLIHGLGDDKGDWNAVLPSLADHYRVYAFDLRGHGQSSHPGEYALELLRDDAIAFLDAVEIERCVMVGHSLGGLVAILVAEAAQHRLTDLILEDIFAPRPGDLQRPPLPRPDTPTAFDFAAVNALRVQLNDPDPAWSDRTEAVTVPTLVIGGGPDSPIPQHRIAEMVDRMPDATLVTIPAGHDIHRTRPAEFLAVVANFLASRIMPEQPTDNLT